jgi:hypothetical protein
MISRVDAVELYDHQADPREDTNVAGLPENAELAKRLTAQLRQGWQATRRGLPS